ncbi:MAG TPA: PDZ domain-containing protein [Pyrinomonadaceae bacterium]|nr:PDZ domain-containing protein [Pyrinomonadaceae bacterium]
MSLNPEMDPSVISCANCHAPMPRELRFCRNCGFRLGEGSAEYTETVRFQNVPGAATAGNSAFPGASYSPPGALSASQGGPLKKRKRRLSGMTWMFLGLLIFFIAAAAITSIIRPIRQNIRDGIAQSAAAPRSYVGVHEFDTAEGGVMLDNVEPPGSPADLAGLVGGDIITTVDGQPVTTDDEMMDLLGRTPIGKTIELIYLRDGEQKTTKLTTISKAEFDRLLAEYRARPAGKGQFGYEEDDSERVPIHNTKMFGVRLDNISSSMPADMAGIKVGDIIIEFDKVPIRTTEELLWRIRRAIPYSTVTVVVMRGEERLEIPVKMGKAPR